MISIPSSSSQAALSPLAPAGVQVGQGASIADQARFEQALNQALGQIEAPATPAPSEALQAMARPLEHVDREADALAGQAREAQTAQTDFTPGDMVMLSMRCQEFMFHCQLTANIANRASEGLQQLFRQQS